MAAAFLVHRHKEAASQHPHSVTLHWRQSPAADSYNIYRRTEDSSFTKIGTAATPTYVDAPVPAGEVLFYAVTTVQGKDESRFSDVIRVEVPSNPWF
jgi:fibronectin type 3 domain-containing protein